MTRLTSGPTCTEPLAARRIASSHAPACRAAAVHAQLAREQRVEVERHRFGVDGDDADRAPDANDLGDQRRRVRAAADLEGEVGAGAIRPCIHHRLDVVGRTHRVETGALQHLHAVGIDLDDFHLGAAVAADERDQRPDRPAAEDHDTIAGLDLALATSCVATASGSMSACVVMEMASGSFAAWRRAPPSILHPAGDVHAQHLQVVAEIRRAHPAGAARAAELDGLDDHAVAFHEPLDAGAVTTSANVSWPMIPPRGTR